MTSNAAVRNRCLAQEGATPIARAQALLDAGALARRSLEVRGRTGLVGGEAVSGLDTDRGTAAPPYEREARRFASEGHLRVPFVVLAVPLGGLRAAP